LGCFFKVGEDAVEGVAPFGDAIAAFDDVTVAAVMVGQFFIRLDFAGFRPAQARAGKSDMVLLAKFAVIPGSIDVMRSKRLCIVQQ